jgi:hypothetical protein
MSASSGHACRLYFSKKFTTRSIAVGRRELPRMDMMEGQGAEEEEVYGEDEEFLYECHGSAEENAFDQAIGLIEETLMGALFMAPSFLHADAI